MPCLRRMRAMLAPPALSADYGYGDKGTCGGMGSSPIFHRYLFGLLTLFFCASCSSCAHILPSLGRPRFNAQ